MFTIDENRVSDGSMANSEDLLSNENACWNEVIVGLSQGYHDDDDNLNLECKEGSCTPS